MEGLRGTRGKKLKPHFVKVKENEKTLGHKCAEGGNPETNNGGCWKEVVLRKMVGRITEGPMFLRNEILKPAIATSCVYSA